MRVEYKVIRPDEVTEDDADWYGNFRNLVVRFEDGVNVAILGSDGGETEDQTLRRDWSWVAPALQAAYELGVSHTQGGK